MYFLKVRHYKLLINLSSLIDLFAHYHLKYPGSYIIHQCYYFTSLRFVIHLNTKFFSNHFPSYLMMAINHCSVHCYYFLISLMKAR